ncbi:MAG: hypothetical protein VXW87_04895 [Pseudomonadota bacterium]|nr:hypothetical protein [Pseudomonadota bacterium]
MNAIIAHIANLLTPQHMGYVRFARQHCNKTIAFRYANSSIQFQIHQSGMIAAHVAFDDADCRITFNIEAIMKFIGMSVSGSEMTIEGDQALGQGFVQLLSIKHFDHQAWLYHWLPQSLATISIELLDASTLLGRYVLSTVKEQLHCYLVYEAGFCASKTECDRQYQDTLNATYQLEWLSSQINSKL